MIAANIERQKQSFLNPTSRAGLCSLFSPAKNTELRGVGRVKANWGLSPPQLCEHAAAPYGGRGDDNISAERRKPEEWKFFYKQG
jgi:hypothetical protein